MKTLENIIRLPLAWITPALAISKYLWATILSDSVMITHMLSNRNNISKVVFDNSNFDRINSGLHLYQNDQHFKAVHFNGNV